MSDQHANPHGSPQEGGGPPGWFDRPANVQKVVWALYAACGVFVLLELANLGMHFYHPHETFGFEKIPGINALFGAAFYCAIVFTAKGLRTIVKRPEDYYE